MTFSFRPYVLIVCALFCFIAGGCVQQENTEQEIVQQKCPEVEIMQQRRPEQEIVHQACPEPEIVQQECPEQECPPQEIVHQECPQLECPQQDDAQPTPAARNSNSTLPRVTIPHSEVRTLKSAHTGRTYDVYIRLPDEYAQNTDRHYPVLYVLDGQWDFKLLDSIYGGLEYDEFVPEIIIVGVTYAGDNPDYGALRAMDYTPVADSTFPGSGDAPLFLNFLKEELIPLIETNYRADTSHRTLMGSSFGGLFTLYAMFTEPELFAGYVAASPIIIYANKAILTQETEYATRRQDLPVNLYVSVGELEPHFAPSVKEFIEIMNQRGYQDLNMKTQIVEGERHAGNKPEAFNRGLRFVFQDEE